MGGGAFEQQAALLEGFGNQLEVEVVEVTKAAVYELGGPGAGASCPVAGLNNGGAQAAGCGVQGDACPGHPAADDEDVYARFIGHGG